MVALIFSMPKASPTPSVSEPLPTFRYHPDPVASGSVESSSERCRCCKRARGAIYTGPVFAEKDLDDKLCPWCIADGSAAEKFGATFTDIESLDDGIPEAVAELLITRTPGVAHWQSGRWPACCGDACAFLAPMGIAEARAHRRELEGELMGYIVHEMGISGGAASRLLQSLSRDHGPTLMLFRCLSCAREHPHLDMP